MQFPVPQRASICSHAFATISAVNCWENRPQVQRRQSEEPDIHAGRAVATFPKAKYYAPEGEWQHGQLQLERDRVSYISDNYNPLIGSGQMKLLHGQVEIVPGITVVPTPGHTRNMNAVLIESGG